MWPNMQMQQSFGEPSPSPMPFQNADATAEGGLVEQIKQLCRENFATKTQWVAFTDMHAQGRRDPARHTPEFLQEFLTHLASGVQLTPAPEADLSKAIKVLQKQSGPQFRQAWTNFCMMSGGGRNDPSKHNGDFHLQFFEALAQQAVMNSGGDMNAMQGGGGMKRNASAMMGGMGGGGTGSAKDVLVSRLKTFQRSSPDNKELWTAYCVTYLGGALDPNRHDEAILKEFCDNHGVPNDGDFVPAGAPAMPLDPAMEMYVTKVKDYTKSGPEGKGNWLAFCGRHRDPARHTMERLQEFCAAYGL